MKSPADKTTIQIEITNLCYHNCANCTRHCGHQPKPFFMDLETFKKAVDSLEGYPHTIGIMGGEPTLHPDFEKLMAYYREKTLNNKIFTDRYAITSSFHFSTKMTKRGLWTSLGKYYYKHFETIQDTFDFQVVNDHNNATVHQGMLIARKDLGIPDEEWIGLRDKCWLQNLWSASITPKGCFFCEVAAALDWLFDGPGGWPIEPGWWERSPEDFGDQLQWCELCSAALPVPVSSASSHMDLISPSVLEKLKKIGSKKIERGQYRLFTREDFLELKMDNEKRKYNGNWYIDESSAKRINTRSTLFSSHFTINSHRTDDCFDGNMKDWYFAVFDKKKGLKKRIAFLSRYILNPGCLYYYIPDPKKRLNNVDNIIANADFIGFNELALSLKNQKWPMTFKDIVGAYPESKRIHADDFMRQTGVLKVLKAKLSPLKRAVMKVLKG